MISSLMAFLHHLSAFTLTACLVYEFVAYRKDMSFAEARRIQQVDLLYGISAGALLDVGLLRVFYFEKGSAFYSQNMMFWIKMILFGVVGVLSVYPTIRYIQWNPVLAEGRAPEIAEQEFKITRNLLLVEVAGLALILFAAPAMARAIWMLG